MARETHLTLGQPEEYVRCSTLEEVETEILNMGWLTVADFEDDTGMQAAALVGLWWAVVNDRVFTETEM